MTAPPSHAKRSPDVPPVAVNYDRMSRWYDWLAAPAEWPAVSAGVRMAALADGERVLELGSGVGRALEQFGHAAGASGAVVGVDLSTGMNRRARGRIANAGLSERVIVIDGDAENLPYDDDTFDAVFMSFFLELLYGDKTRRVLAECRRLLKPGGRLVVVAISADGAPTIALRLYRWAHRKFPALVDCRPIDVESALEGAGFSVEKSERMQMWRLPVALVAARPKAP